MWNVRSRRTGPIEQYSELPVLGRLRSLGESREGKVIRMTALGQKVKEQRVLKGMTQQRLAEKAGMGHSLISALESGRRKYLSAQDVDSLAKGLDMKADDLWKLIPGGRSDQRYISIAGSTDTETKATRAA